MQSISWNNLAKKDPEPVQQEVVNEEVNKDINNIDNHVQNKIEEDKKAEEQNLALLPPKKPDGPGELGKPYRVDKGRLQNKKRLKLVTLYIFGSKPTLPSQLVT